MKAEQLRKSILQLAILGKLVPQDPNDEPASVLLERIHAEKQRLIKEGKIKKDKMIPSSSKVTIIAIMRRWARKLKILPMIYPLKYPIVGHGLGFRRLYLLSLVKRQTDILINFGAMVDILGLLYQIFKKDP